MFKMEVEAWELIVRAAIVYLFLLVLLRVTGKRQIGQLAPFDLVLLLVLANAVQNSINAGDNSMIGGLISAVTLVMLNYLVGFGTYKSKRLEALIEGDPILLIHNGHVSREALSRAQLTQHELMSALRLTGCDAISDVRVAILENNGSISVIPRRDRKSPSPQEDKTP